MAQVPGFHAHEPASRPAPDGAQEEIDTVGRNTGEQQGDEEDRSHRKWTSTRASMLECGDQQRKHNAYADCDEYCSHQSEQYPRNRAVLLELAGGWHSGCGV